MINYFYFFCQLWEKFAQTDISIGSINIKWKALIGSGDDAPEWRAYPARYALAFKYVTGKILLKIVLLLQHFYW